MSVREKVGIFLFALAQGVSNRTLSERFQPSGETISRAIHDVLNSIACRMVKVLAHDIIRPYDPDFKSIPAKISTDKRYMPYFKDCIGCIDGTHIEACIPEALQMPYRGRKGIPTFNVIVVCDFDMCFTFVSAGWEGSSHDSHVFLHAIGTPEFNFPKPPEDKYYLVDKGYQDRDGYFVPYPRLSCIEKSFGVLKQRWKILTILPQFRIETQIQIIVATFALHNYIRINSQDYPLFRVLEEYPALYLH
ncbi:putative nuclease HARBI1 [Bienertia sinuspersici]